MVTFYDFIVDYLGFSICPQIGTTFFLPFCSVCLLFYFFALLCWLVPTLYCWIDIFALFLIFGISIQTFTNEYDVSLSIFENAFYLLEEFPIFPVFLELLYFKWALNFIKYFFCIKWLVHVIFLYLVNMDYMDRF